MYWTIIDNRTGENVERAQSERDAIRAMAIFCAHEIKNGRAPNYSIVPTPLQSVPYSDLDLPSWAEDALGIKHE